MAGGDVEAAEAESPLLPAGVVPGGRALGARPVAPRRPLRSQLPCLLHRRRRLPAPLERLHHRRRLLRLSLPGRPRRPRLLRRVHALLPPPLLLIVLCFPKSSAPTRINTGLTLFTLALLVVPAMDAVYVRGRPGLYGAVDVTVGATVLCGAADAFVQGGVIGFAGELPERYMQAVVAGTAASAGGCN